MLACFLTCVKFVCVLFMYDYPVFLYLTLSIFCIMRNYHFNNNIIIIISSFIVIVKYIIYTKDVQLVYGDVS